MSIFRVEKNTNYTVISNYHLRDKNLSLKTIGLLSLILSLPESWDYSQAGLAAICKDGEDSIRSGLKELEKYGYLERERERDENGRMRGIVYHIYEVPKDKRQVLPNTNTQRAQRNCGGLNKTKCNSQATPESDLPKQENPMLVSPTLEHSISANPTYDFPTQDNNTQIITNKQNKDKQNKELTNTHPSIYQLNKQMDEQGSSDHRTALEMVIKENIGYEYFEFKQNDIDSRLENGTISISDYDEAMLTYDLRTIGKIVGYMLDILSSLNNDPIKIGDELIDRGVVKSKLMKVGMQSMKHVVFELNTNPAIKNPKKYAISMLYNS